MLTVWTMIIAVGFAVLQLLPPLPSPRRPAASVQSSPTWPVAGLLVVSDPSTEDWSVMISRGTTSDPVPVTRLWRVREGHWCLLVSFPSNNPAASHATYPVPAHMLKVDDVVMLETSKHYSLVLEVVDKSTGQLKTIHLFNHISERKTSTLPPSGC